MSNDGKFFMKVVNAWVEKHTANDPPEILKSDLYRQLENVAVDLWGHTPSLESFPAHETDLSTWLTRYANEIRANYGISFSKKRFSNGTRYTITKEKPVDFFSKILVRWAENTIREESAVWVGDGRDLYVELREVKAGSGMGEHDGKFPVTAGDLHTYIFGRREHWESLGWDIKFESSPRKETLYQIRRLKSKDARDASKNEAAIYERALALTRAEIEEIFIDDKEQAEIADCVEMLQSVVKSGNNRYLEKYAKHLIEESRSLQFPGDILKRDEESKFNNFAFELKELGKKSEIVIAEKSPHWMATEYSAIIQKDCTAPGGIGVVFVARAHLTEPVEFGAHLPIAVENSAQLNALISALESDLNCSVDYGRGEVANALQELLSHVRQSTLVMREWNGWEEGYLTAVKNKLILCGLWS